MVHCTNVLCVCVNGRRETHEHSKLNKTDRLLYERKVMAIKSFRTINAGNTFSTISSSINQIHRNTHTHTERDSTSCDANYFNNCFNLILFDAVFVFCLLAFFCAVDRLMKLTEEVFLPKFDLIAFNRQYKLMNRWHITNSTWSSFQSKPYKTMKRSF